MRAEAPSPLSLSRRTLDRLVCGPAALRRKLIGKAATFLLFALGLSSLGAPARAGESGDLVVVVYNKQMSESKAVAQHYAKLRQVPDSQVIGFSLPVTETMTRAEFKGQLQQPLYDHLVSRGVFKLSAVETAPDGVTKRQRVIRSGIRYGVLCYGVPLKILHDATLLEPGSEKLPAELRKNGAAVDTELALLPLTRQVVMLAGLAPNPFYGATGPNLQRIHPTNGLVMVTRLDGPSPEIARGLVDKALEAEKYGLWGRAYFDARGLTEGSYLPGDQWMRGGADWARRMGFETVLDMNPDTFPDAFPLSQVALYAGWYAGQACGPFARPQVEFVPGAFAYHLHSSSAVSVRSPNSYWVGPFLAKGATITMGSVDEPYLPWTPDVAVFLQNLLHSGASFGEAAYSGERNLSWQTTIVGDPLYRPFAQPLDLLHYNLELRHSRLIEWSHLLVVNRNQEMKSAPDELIGYLQQQPFTRHSAVMTEKLADLQKLKGDLVSALESCQQALDRHPSPQQKVRLLLTLAEWQTSTGREKEAAQTYQRFLKECADYPAPLSIHQKLLALARRLNDKDLTAKCEEEIKRLTPPPPAAK